MKTDKTEYGKTVEALANKMQDAMRESIKQFQPCDDAPHDARSAFLEAWAASAAQMLLIASASSTPHVEKWRDRAELMIESVWNSNIRHIIEWRDGAIIPDGFDPARSPAEAAAAASFEKLTEMGFDPAGDPWENLMRVTVSNLQTVLRISVGPYAPADDEQWQKAVNVGLNGLAFCLCDLFAKVHIDGTTLENAVVTLIREQIKRNGDVFESGRLSTSTPAGHA